MAKPTRQKKLQALYDFEARSADELSFVSGQELLLIDKTGSKQRKSENRTNFLSFLSDETWWKAELDGRTGRLRKWKTNKRNRWILFRFSGVVPSNYVQLLDWSKKQEKKRIRFVLLLFSLFLHFDLIERYCFSSSACFLFHRSIETISNNFVLLFLYFCIWSLILILFFHSVLMIKTRRKLTRRR